MSGAAPRSDAASVTATGGATSVRRWLGPLLAVPTPVIFVAAAAVACVLLWRQGALVEVGASLHAADPRLIAGVLLLYATSILALALRWHALVRMVGGAPPWSISAEVFLTSVIVNYAAPIGLAVPTRAALTVRDLGLKPGPSAAVVAWEACLDVAALAAISALWLIGGGRDLVRALTIDARVVPVAAVVAVVAVALAVVVTWRTPLGPRLAGAARRFLAFPAERPAVALLAAGLTTVFWAGQSVVMAALLQVFGVAATPSLVLGVMGLPVLVGMLSPVPGGAGVREGLMAAVAKLEGTAMGPVVLAAVAYRLALFVVTPVVWGLARAIRGWQGGRVVRS
jgi:uncharacterized membrane protein YbhN (UPF0104 family)